MTMKRFGARVAFATVATAALYGLHLIPATTHNSLILVKGGEPTTALILLVSVILATAGTLAGMAALVGGWYGMVALFKAGWR